MSRVVVVHQFDLTDEHHQQPSAEDIDYLAMTMTVQVEEPIIGAGPGAFDEIEGYTSEIGVRVITNDGDPVDRALEAFWSVIALSHPQIKTGDLDPGTAVMFDQAARDAVFTWLRYNNPQPRA